MVRRTLGVGAILVAMVGLAAAQQVVGPPITLNVEQPAVAGLPVWLDVEVQDKCLAPRFDPARNPAQAEGGADHAEVLFNGQPAPAASYPVNAGPPPAPGPPCGAAMGVASGGDRFPLHLAADLSVPGDYKVRWVIDGAAGAVVARSDWVAFTVQKAAPGQRDGWLTLMLAHRPDDADSVVRDYIPSLLAAWHDPGVTRALLELACLADARINAAAAAALRDFREDGRRYLAQLLTNGCMSEAMPHVLFAMMQWAPAQRDALAQAIALHLEARSGAALAESIASLEALRPVLVHDDSDARTQALVDQHVLRVAPWIVAGPDDVPKLALTEYLTQKPPLAGAVALLRALAVQPGAAAPQAMGDLVYLARPADMAWFRSVLVDAKVAPPESLVMIGVQGLARAVGRPAVGVLQAVMAKATSWQVRDTAAIELGWLGDRAGVAAVVAALRTPADGERDFVMSNLNGVRSARHPLATPEEAVAYFEGRVAVPRATRRRYKS